jgi:hypothetical protein
VEDADVSDKITRDPASTNDRPRLGRALARLMGGAEESSIEQPVAAAAPPKAEDNFTAGQPGEHGGPKGPEPTRYGDWERKGRCVDF